MSKRWILASLLAGGTGLCATIAWSDSGGSGSAAQPPTAPAGSGSAGVAVDLQPIPYEQMSPTDQAVIDRGRNVDDWYQVHDAFASASIERAARAEAHAAAQQLGANQLAQEGVVP